MSLEDALTEAMCHAWNALNATGPKDVTEPADFRAEAQSVLFQLRDLAHDGVLVVDFRTDPAGEVLRAKHKWSWETLAAPDGTPRCNHPRGVDCIVSNHTHTPLYALVRPIDGSTQ